MQQLPIQPEARQNNAETVALDVRGMKCAGCVKAVERQLTQNPGVVAASVNLLTEVAIIKYLPQELEPTTLAESLTAKGFPSQLRPSEASSTTELLKNAAKRREKEQSQQLRRLIAAAILLFFSIFGHLHHLGLPSVPLLSNIWFHWGLATLSLLLVGGEILLEGWQGLWAKIPNMNTLVGLGAVSAYLASCIALLFPKLGWECFFDEPVMLLGFILLGRTLEGRARGKAAAALESLVALQPEIARLVASQQEMGIEIPAHQVRLGEWIKILPGEKIPVDGEVLAGASLVDESMLTGEAMPVSKDAGDGVAAGTLNLSGVITVKTTRIGNNTTLSQIISSVEKAQNNKAPVQKLADTLAGYFAYLVMGIALLTFIFWDGLGTRIWPEVLLIEKHGMLLETSPLLLSLKLAIATLVIACPCALGLATPTAILVGTGIGAEKGLLIKGGEVLETIHHLDTIVFDKTGTLTAGYPAVTDCISLANLSQEDLLEIAAAVEVGTNHPLARAIVAANKRNLSPLTATGFRTEAGLGVSATIEGQRVVLGNASCLQGQGISINQEVATREKALSEAGKTVVYLAQGGQILGIIALEDKLRQDAASTVSQLLARGLRVVLLTGDGEGVAQAIADQLGITEVLARVKPQEKATVIASLQQGKEGEKSVVAMVGDGINDAPALAQADLGIALCEGTEVAMETAAIVLMRNRLSDLIESIDLSNATFDKICQNLLWALGYNLIMIPIAGGVLLPQFGVILSPAMAGALMALSSVLVVTNSLLLRLQWPKRSNKYLSIFMKTSQN
jgi:Cu2+-exporting ATPase